MPQSNTPGRKDQIEQVAQALFKKKGYAATSMRDIAAELGIKVSSIYSHIASKEDILKKICFKLAEEFFKMAAETQKQGVKPDEKLRLAIIAHIKVVTSNIEAVPIFLNDWRYLNEPDLSEFKKQRKQYDLFFRNIIQEGISEGIFKDIDAKFTALMIFSALNWLYDWYKPAGKMPPEAIGENLYNLLFNGLLR